MAKQEVKRGHKNRRFVTQLSRAPKKARRGVTKTKRVGTNRHPV